MLLMSISVMVGWSTVPWWWRTVQDPSRPRNVIRILLLFLLQDFLCYWFHRASHRIRWMWASHLTHHSSGRLNLSAGTYFFDALA